MGANYVYGGLTLPLHTMGGHAAFLELSMEEASWYISLVPVLQMLGILAGFPASEAAGRRTVLALSSLLSIVGYVIMYFGHQFWLLALGRSINSFSIGLGSMMPYILTSEFATITLRAPAAVTNTLAFALGGLLAFLFTSVLHLSYLLHMCVLLSATFLLLCPLLPPSPHHLVRRGRVEEARVALRRLRGAHYKGVEEELEEVEALSRVVGEGSWVARWRESTFLQPLAILATLTLLISLSGLDCPLTFYGPTIFAMFGSVHIFRLSQDQKHFCVINPTLCSL